MKWTVDCISLSHLIRLPGRKVENVELFPIEARKKYVVVVILIRLIELYVRMNE